LLAFTAIILFLCYKTGFFSGTSQGHQRESEVEKLKDVVNELKKENQQLQQKLIFLERDYQIQSETRKNLGNHLKLLHEQNAELTKDMALYQTIAGTSSVSQGLQIKAFQVFGTEQAQTFRYLLVLSKQSAPQKYAMGAVTMTILGRIGEKSIQLPVKYVDSQREDGLAFKFRHFQELTGELSFPEQFIPDAVFFQVNPDEEWPHFQQQFPWVSDNIPA
jgi:hypothetical protein